jgi:hypothetical protein
MLNDLFCTSQRLAVTPKNQFGKIIKNLNRYIEYRESSGDRRTMWKGIKLKEAYCIDIGQQQLIDTN